MTHQYYRQTRPSWGPGAFQSMVMRIILANVVVYTLQGMFPAINTYLALTPRLVVENFQFWQIGTYMFLHGGFTHLLFNMLMLWIFGRTIESVWGPRQFLRYYLFCGIGGAVASLFFNYDSHIVGASGAIFGLYIAYAMMFPNNHIYLYFLFPVKAKYLVTGIAVIQLANGIFGPSGIAYFAHLGGMAAGLVFFKTDLLSRFRHKTGPQRKWKQYMEERNRNTTSEERDNIDSILDKISAKGFDDLSPTEKRILENYSRKHSDDETP